ncbi:YlxM family DNA-binding protein [Lactobacillus corticis]|uniref:UPF0122 protein LCB40_11020 n=1 Tax=Lactobacillus corticis TaxID=2201249 RepID=A0A916QJZ9_9LACO|nr:transcriptional regulator [Lactobacillus corticis]GFZ27222.1 DNA-binding protein [Lactobacillus corticis]
MDELTKNERLGDLYAYYGPLLTKAQQDYFEDYYYNDLSLSEIATNHGVSRQAVYDNTKRTAKILEDYEAKLHFKRDLTHLDQLSHETEQLLTQDKKTAAVTKLHEMQKIIRGE